MKSYGQFCPVAKALDVIGDRWSLLIVRELLLRGACRYTDLRTGLPGIATNLLAERLRDLEEVGVVTSRHAPPPVATTLFSLTQRGAELEPVIMQLGRWGLPLLQESAGGEDLQGHWLSVPARLRLVDHAPEEPPVTIEVRTGEEPLVIEVDHGDVRAFGGPAHGAPDAVISGPALQAVALITGRISLDEALERGLTCEGSRSAVERILPSPATASPAVPA